MQCQLIAGTICSSAIMLICVRLGAVTAFQGCYHPCRASFVALFWAVLLGRSRPWLCTAVAAWALTTALSRAAMG
jgi:hypothetical protein